MQCPHHNDKTVVGYCAVCGELRCEVCLHEIDNALYCRKDVQPILQKLKDELHASGGGRHYPRIVARTQEGKAVRGYCLHLNPASRGFHVEDVDRHGQLTGEAQHVLFQHLKAVFFVKHFKECQVDVEKWIPWKHCGEPLVVRFQDREVLQGFAHKPLTPIEPRFLLIPADQRSNNRGVLCERSFVEGVYTPKAFDQKIRQELETWLLNHSHDGISPEEATGDFFFARNDYARAVKHYRQLKHLAGSSRRIRKKLVKAQYNLGACHLRRHEYEQALDCLEHVLDLAPKSQKAKEKATRIRHKLAREV